MHVKQQQSTLIFKFLALVTLLGFFVLAFWGAYRIKKEWEIASLASKHPDFFDRLFMTKKVSCSNHQALEERLRETFSLVNRSYVDLSRVKYDEMLAGALDELQKMVPELSVQKDFAHRQIAIQMGKASKKFNLNAGKEYLWLYNDLIDMMCFMNQNAYRKENSSYISDLYYTAARGALSSLDPHSILLSPAQAQALEASFNTQKFGGLGLTLGFKKGRISVLDVRAQSPAAQAGIQKGTQILCVDNQDITHYRLQDSVDRMRGTPKTPVTLCLKRPHQSAIEKVTLVREEIYIPNVTGRVLSLVGRNVGYVRIEKFSKDIHEQLDEWLKTFSESATTGIILDLRGNPGGLLEEAVRVIGKFVHGGPAVGIESANNPIESTLALSSDWRTDAPLIILVDENSASASEIVAGTLQGRGRAVVMGRTTFGKSSVQNLWKNPDGSQLKLTTHRYLVAEGSSKNPKFRSIQSRGITPDIELQTVWISSKKEDLLLYDRFKGVREGGLRATLESATLRQEDPFMVIPYVAVQAAHEVVEEDDEESTPLVKGEEESLESDKVNQSDYPMQFAFDFLLQAKGQRRDEILRNSKVFLKTELARHEDQIALHLRNIEKIDWSRSVPQPGRARLQISFTADKPMNEEAYIVDAGEKITLRGMVKNLGAGTAFRVRSKISSTNRFFDGREFMFGTISPGHSAEWSLSLSLPKGMTRQKIFLTMDSFAENAELPQKQALVVLVNKIPLPQLSYRYRIVEELGNKDGLLQVGETVKLSVTVKNMGPTPTKAISASIFSEDERWLQIELGQYVVDRIEPQAQRTFDFTFLLKKKPRDSDAIGFKLFDAQTVENIDAEFKIPVVDQPMRFSPQSSLVYLPESTPLYMMPSKTFGAIGAVQQGSCYSQIGQVPGFRKISISTGEIVFAEIIPGTLAECKTVQENWSPLWQGRPPKISSLSVPLTIDGPQVELSAVAEDEEGIFDASIQLYEFREGTVENNEKPYYALSPNSANPRKMLIRSRFNVNPGQTDGVLVIRNKNLVKTIQRFSIHRTR